MIYSSVVWKYGTLGVEICLTLIAGFIAVATFHTNISK